jgi:acyl-coenzyme A synthetase/AMP-(fatty) acid ligase
MSDSSLHTHPHLEPHVLEQPANRDEAFVVMHPWIQHYEQGVPAHIEIPDQPLTWLLDRTASRYPGRTALIYSGKCRTGSIGLPLPGVEAAIVNQETGEPVPTGEEGELVVRGPNIMQGYWNRPEETCQVLHIGWLRTGDLGKMDADGYFSIVERVKDVIIASGLKVYPGEVEEVLFQHPAVAEVAVAGAADAYRGETVAAFVVLKPGMEASQETRRGYSSIASKNWQHIRSPRSWSSARACPSP